jgi:Lrp/AsnC family leucine-responsive transcriptional regulator
MSVAFDHERLLDDVGWRLLEELQANARLSYSELGRRVGLTAPAVAERIRRLEEAGVIAGYHAELNLAKLGLTLQVIIRLTAPEGKCAHFASVAQQFPEILECHRVTGTDSYVLRACLASVPHLEQLLNRLAQHGGTMTSIVLSSPITHRVIHAADLPASAPDLRPAS